MPPFSATLVPALGLPVVFLHDDSSFASNIANFLVRTTSIFQTSIASNFSMFSRVVAVVALQTASLMSLVKLGNVNSKSRVLLITEEKLTDESTSLLTQVVQYVFFQYFRIELIYCGCFCIILINHSRFSATIGVGVGWWRRGVEERKKMVPTDGRGLPA